MKGKIRKKVIPIALAVCLAPALGFAQVSPDSVRELERKLEVLTEEIEQLKLGEAAEEPGYRTQYGLGPAASKVYRAGRKISLAGYGEMVYENFSDQRDDGASSGKKDQLDFLRQVIYLGYKFNDRILFNSEIEFEHASTGKSGEVSLEFAYLDFLLWEPFNVRAGMVLAPLGLINEIHEPPAFHGSKRPDVETNIIPTTWRFNGAGLFGEAGPLRYRAYLSEGFDVKEGVSASSGLRSARQKGSNAELEDVAFSARLDYEGIPGLAFGGSFYSGQSGQSTPTVSGEILDGRTTLWDLHGTFQHQGVEVRALFVKLLQSQAGEISANLGQTLGERMQGWYVEAAYDLLPFFLPGTSQYLAPFFRYEDYDTHQRAPAGLARNSAVNRTTITYGLTYKPHPNVAVKGDYQDRKDEAGRGVNQWNMAVGYMF
ncbi:MAG: hypothetical protein HY402_03635 [Elusimicrobia bacterium]|nr:hypothetical protein [Elusimicrobiota bacterium]